MNGYQLTDEQIEALADQIPLGFDPLRDPYANTHEAAVGIASSPAFQSIIRAAQEEAYDRGFYDREALSPVVRGRRIGVIR